MSENASRQERIAHAAREVAAEGRCKDITEIEVFLILRDFGDAAEILRDPLLRAELELLCEEASERRKR